MDDDWRLRIDLHDHGRAHSLLERLDGAELEHRLETSFGDRVVVSREGTEVFCYAGTREQAERAGELARQLAAEHGWEIELELSRWHPIAQRWENPDRPLPATDEQRAAEHRQMIEEEREEPFPEFEVRVQCTSREAARELAHRLRSERLPHVRRSNFVLVGAPDEDTAQRLARRLREEAPPGSLVLTEGTAGAVLARIGPNPFSIFGGLGI